MSTEPPDTPDTEPIEPAAAEPAAAAAEPTPVPPPAAGPAPLAPAANPRPSTTLTWALVGVALVLAGFLGGYFVGHHAGGHANRSAFMRHGFGRARDGFGPGFGVFPGGANGGFSGPTAPSGPNAQGGFPIAGDFIVGTVSRVSGSSVYVRERDGSTVKVDTDSRTLVHVGSDGGLSDLAPGAAVVVRGTPNGQGGITASFIAQIGRYASGTATT